MVLVYTYSGHVKLLKCPTASFLFFQIVNLIEETGHFHITNTTFDFDLCSLDKTTVRKLQSYLETSGTSWGFSIWLRQKLLFKLRMQNDVTKMEGKKQKPLQLLFFLKASLLTREKVTRLRGPLFSRRKCSGRVCLDSLEKQTQEKKNTCS